MSGGAYSTDMWIHMLVDVCVDMCVDMGVDLGVDMWQFDLQCRHVYTHARRCASVNVDV